MIFTTTTTNTENLMRTHAKALLLFALMLATIIAPSANAALTETTTYAVTLLKYEPTPAQPGDIVEAWIQVTNTGRLASPQTTLQLDASYPFTPVNAQDATVSVGSIAAGSTYVTRIKLAVDSAATDGTYQIPVRLTSNGNDYLTTDLDVQVRAPNAVLSVVSAKTNPEQTVPGTPTSFEVTIANTQSSTLRDVSISLDLDGTGLATVGTTSAQTLARLSGNSQQTVRFMLLAEPEAQSGVISVPVTFTFLSAAGTSVTQTETVGIVVHAPPEVTVLVDRVTRDTQTKELEVLMRVVNKGLSQIKFAELTLASSDEYTIANGRDVVYVGNIDSDDFQTAEYTLSDVSGQTTLRGTLTYRDALNEQFSVPVSVTMNAPPAASGGLSPLVWVVLIVLVIGGVIAWRRRKKK